MMHAVATYLTSGIIMQACKIHRRATEEMKLEKAKAISEEESLKESVNAIRKKIMQERKTKILYEVCI